MPGWPDRSQKNFIQAAGIREACNNVRDHIRSSFSITELYVGTPKTTEAAYEHHLI